MPERTSEPNSAQVATSAVRLKVKTRDVNLGLQREDLAQKVIDFFDEPLPDCKLLCFFDDEDCQEFKNIMGQRNRAFHRRISDKTPFVGWPGHITDCIFLDDGVSLFYPRIFDHVIYLYGSTCADKVGMTMSFAHELQHVVQSLKTPDLLAVNNIVRFLPRKVINELGLQWSDIPTEREARAVGKRIAVQLHGCEAVQQFVSARLASEQDPDEIADLRFIQQLEPSTSYSVEDTTAVLFGRLRKYRGELEESLKFMKTDPEFEPIPLDAWMTKIETVGGALDPNH